MTEMSLLQEGATFNSYNEFQTVLANFCRQTNSRFVVHDCKMIERFNTGRLLSDRLPLFLKYKYAKIACERFGQPRHEGRGIRNKGSKKNGCGAHVTLTARRTRQGCGVLCVMKCETKHSNQCEMRRKQKRMKMGLGAPPTRPYHPKKVQKKREDRPRIKGPRVTLEVPGHNFQVKPELLAEFSDDSDNSLQEYNYDVKPMVVYSDEEGEEQKPVPIFHLNDETPRVVPEDMVQVKMEPDEPTEPEEPMETVDATVPEKETVSEEAVPGEVTVLEEVMVSREMTTPEVLTVPDELTVPEVLTIPEETSVFEEPAVPELLTIPGETSVPEVLTIPEETSVPDVPVVPEVLMAPKEPTVPPEPAEPTESEVAPPKYAELMDPEGSSETSELVDPQGSAESADPTVASKPIELTEPSDVSILNEDESDSEDVKPVLPLLPVLPELPKLPECEDVKPLRLADKPSLRALLLPAMALNFSQRTIHTET